MNWVVVSRQHLVTRLCIFVVYRLCSICNIHVCLYIFVVYYIDNLFVCAVGYISVEQYVLYCNVFECIGKLRWYWKVLNCRGTKVAIDWDAQTVCQNCRHMHFQIPVYNLQQTGLFTQCNQIQLIKGLETLF